MTNEEFDFGTWFSTLQNQVLDRTGVDFQDQDSVRADYDAGRDVYDVIDQVETDFGD